MENKLRRLLTIAMMTFLIGALLICGHHGHAMAAGNEAQESGRTCPYQIVEDAGMTAEIVNIFFTDRVDGQTYRYEVSDERKAKYRYAIVSLKITKPAGKRLSLAAADLTLHYYHGNYMEVAECGGLSWFKNDNDSDAPLQVNRYWGPGFLKKTTGARCTKASVVYIDAVFQSMEQDTKECWICVAQPLTRQPSYVCPSPAWTD
jgi:hypothetical protein